MYIYRQISKHPFEEGDGGQVQIVSTLYRKSDLCIPNSYIHVSVSDLCIPRIGLHIWLQQNRQTDPRNI